MEMEALASMVGRLMLEDLGCFLFGGARFIASHPLNMRKGRR